METACSGKNSKWLTSIGLFENHRNYSQQLTISNLYIKILNKKIWYFSYLFHFFNIIVSLSGYSHLFRLDINNDQDRIWDIATTHKEIDHNNRLQMREKKMFKATKGIYSYIYQIESLNQMLYGIPSKLD